MQNVQPLINVFSLLINPLTPGGSLLMRKVLSMAGFGRFRGERGFTNIIKYSTSIILPYQ